MTLNSLKTVHRSYLFKQLQKAVNRFVAVNSFVIQLCRLFVFTVFRLKTFVHDSPEHHRSQLQTLLYPLFVNIYLELLQNAQTAAGGYNKGVAILNITCISCVIL